MPSGHISIWFFIGALLSVYGAIIFASRSLGVDYAPDGQRSACQSARAGVVGRTYAAAGPVLRYKVSAGQSGSDKKVKKRAERPFLLIHFNTYSLVPGLNEPRMHSQF